MLLSGEARKRQPLVAVQQEAEAGQQGLMGNIPSMSEPQLQHNALVGASACVQRTQGQDMHAMPSAGGAGAGTASGGPLCAAADGARVWAHTCPSPCRGTARE